MKYVIIFYFYLFYPLVFAVLSFIAFIYVDVQYELFGLLVFLALFLGFCEYKEWAEGFFISFFLTLAFGGWVFSDYLWVWIIGNIVFFVVAIRTLDKYETKYLEEDDEVLCSDEGNDRVVFYNDEKERKWEAESSKLKSNSRKQSKSDRNDYERGRRDGWRDSYIFGDSFKFDRQCRNQSKSYRDGYDSGFMDGDWD